jgi:hypothetical protein
VRYLLLDGKMDPKTRARFPPEMVAACTELLSCWRAMKDYHVPTWFAYRGGGGGPYDANPPELWRFLFTTDAVLAQMRAAPEPAKGA